MFDATKIVWQNTPAVDHKDPLTTVKSYTSRCMLLADTYSTLSLIQANTKDLDRAIDSATASLQLLNKCIQIVQKSQEKQQQKTELEDPFTDTPPPEQQARKIVFRESQWIMAQKTSACLHTLAQLLIKKGSPNEAKYFVKQGPLLAEKVNSSSMLFDAHLGACEFYLKYGDLNKSQDELEIAMRLEGPVGLAQVKLKVAMANLAVANEYYDIAVGTYDEANELLAQLSNEKEIAVLERLINANEEHKRNKVVFEDEVDRKEITFVFKFINNNSHQLLILDPDKFDCLPLQKLHDFNVIYKGKKYNNFNEIYLLNIQCKLANALAEKGEVADALELLDTFEGSGSSPCYEIELNAAIAHLRLLMIHQDFSMRPEQRLLYNETIVLPAMKTQVSRGGSSMIKQSSIDHELRAMRDALNQSLEQLSEAHQIGWCRERPITIESLCKESVYAMFLKHQMSSNSRMIVNNYSLLCSYYMSMASGINMRREMQYCLGIKLNQSFAGHSPSDTEWPMNSKEKQAYYERLSRMARNPNWLQGHLNTLQDLYREEHGLNDSEFQAKFVDILPNNWTVCSLSLDTLNGDLYVAQLRANEPPFAVKLPLGRTKQRPGNNSSYGSIQYIDAVTELKDIIQGSDETITNSANCNQAGQIEAWWNTRKSLDARLKKLLDDMENQWLSGFKGLLTGRCREYKEELVKFQKAMNEITFKTVNGITATKLKVDLSLAFCRTVVRLGRHPTNRDLEDIVYFVMSCYEAQNIQIDYTKMDFKKVSHF